MQVLWTIFSLAAINYNGSCYLSNDIAGIGRSGMGCRKTSIRNRQIFSEMYCCTVYVQRGAMAQRCNALVTTQLLALFVLWSVQYYVNWHYLKVRSQIKIPVPN